MLCRDAQFYLRLRRPAGDELGADVAADLDRHLAGCPACGAGAAAAQGFDRAVAAVMRGGVPVPAGLRDALVSQASAHHGALIRRKAYQVAAAAAAVLVAVGLGVGVVSVSRPKIDTNEMLVQADSQLQNPDAALAAWLAQQKLPGQLPVPFNTDLLVTLGTERVQGADVPVAVFRHPTQSGFAKLYFFRTDGTTNLNGLRDTNASLTMATVIDGPQHRGVKYVVVHTFHPVNDGESPLKPFLRPAGDTAARL
jgi:anti-sigma factor RsiW